MIVKTCLYAQTLVLTLAVAGTSTTAGVFTGATCYGNPDNCIGDCEQGSLKICDGSAEPTTVGKSDPILHPVPGKCALYPDDIVLSGPCNEVVLGYSQINTTCSAANGTCCFQRANTQPRISSQSDISKVVGGTDCGPGDQILLP